MQQSGPEGAGRGGGVAGAAGLKVEGQGEGELGGKDSYRGQGARKGRADSGSEGGASPCRGSITLNPRQPKPRATAPSQTTVAVATALTARLPGYEPATAAAAVAPSPWQ